MEDVSIHETRRVHLNKLISERFGGRQVDFAKAIDRSSALTWQWGSGHRNIGEKVARHIEDSLKIPRGELDGQPHAPETKKKRRTLNAEELAMAQQLQKAYWHMKSEMQAQGITLTQEKAGLDMGWSGAAAIGQYMNAYVPLNLEAVIRFANYFGIPVKEISPRFGEIISATIPDGNDSTRSPGAQQAYTVPVFSWELEYTDTDPKRIPCGIPGNGPMFVMKVRGESMRNPSQHPSFEDGDTIFLDPAKSAEHRSLVIGRTNGEREAIFRQLIIEGDKRYLKALNPDWPERIKEIQSDFDRRVAGHKPFALVEG